MLKVNDKITYVRGSCSDCFFGRFPADIEEGHGITVENWGVCFYDPPIRSSDKFNPCIRPLVQLSDFCHCFRDRENPINPDMKMIIDFVMNIYIKMCPPAGDDFPDVSGGESDDKTG